MKKVTLFGSISLFTALGFSGCGVLDTSPYYAEMPPKEIIVNGQKVHNPNYDEYVKYYGEDPDACKPVIIKPTISK